MSRQARLGQTTGNLADPSKKDIAQLEATWNAGAVAINAFYDALNTATSTKRLVKIPVRRVEPPHACARRLASLWSLWHVPPPPPASLEAPACPPSPPLLHGSDSLSCLLGRSSARALDLARLPCPR